MAFCREQYFERIGSIQKSMHEREKKRLGLERELFAHSRSDKRVSQIKFAKLCGYLKEIRERETQAKIRNLELLTDVQCIENNMKELRPDAGLLRQQKAKCLNRISEFMSARKNGDETDCAMDMAPALAGLHKNVSHPQTSQLAPIFMARQTYTGYVGEDATTSVHSHQASPVCCSDPTERLQSGLLKDSKVSREAAPNSRAHLSDDISVSNDSLDGYNLSDKHEKMEAVVPSVRALTAEASGPFKGDEQGPSPRATLTRPEKNTLPPSSSILMCARNSLTENAHSRESAHQQLVKENVEKGPKRSTPETEFGKEPQHEQGLHSRTFSVFSGIGDMGSIPSSSMELSVTSGSDLSISLTDSELEDLPHGVVKLNTPNKMESRSTGSPENIPTKKGSEHQSVYSREFSVLESKTLRKDTQLSNSSKESSARLSLEGLFHLMENIEGRLCGEQTQIYSLASITLRKSNELISLCNSGAGLNDEDLEACGAVVLHQLQRLSWSTSKGCLLPQDLVSAHRSTTKPSEISSSLPPDAAPLWDGWFKHALRLKEQRVLSVERLVQLFTPLLLEAPTVSHADYSQQAKVLLRTLLSQSSEECPSAEESESSSCGLPSFLDDSRELQRGRSGAEPLPSQVQGLQSAEEDSQDQSPVESIPIRETKAYQLLKQSATQKRLQSSGEEEEEEEEEEDVAGIKDIHTEDMGRVERSSHQDPNPRKHKTKQRTSAVQSKAFWGESDDSNSEIEAALRPQPSNTTDDFDDFYD
ncbi:centrosomal protein kizuna [Aplochiton taeniatus]